MPSYPHLRGILASIILPHTQQPPPHGRPLYVTPPRKVVPGTTIMLTCRAVGRSFRFLPSKKVVSTLWFVFAYAISRFNVDVHELCWMSNHFHLVLTTRDSQLPAMMQLLDSLASRALNALRAWSGSNIERGYNFVVETDADAILEHCAYTLANPCQADLVAYARQWGGLTSYRLSYGETLTVERPNFGLWGKVRKHLMTSPGRAARAGRTRTPDSVEFKLVRPPVWLDRSDEEVRAEVLRRVAVREAAAEAKRAAKGRRVLGMKRVRQQHWNDIPNSRDDMFGPVPKAAGSRWAVREAKQRCRAFVREHREALVRWLDGELDVVFPYGTYLMRVRYRVRCAGPPLS